MAKKTKEQKQQEKINKLLEKKQLKYSKVEDLQMDLNQRLRISLQNGVDPLGQLSITQIFEDIQTVNKLKGINIEELDE